MYRLVKRVVTWGEHFAIAALFLIAAETRSVRWERLICYTAAAAFSLNAALEATARLLGVPF